ncbi:superoxide reductase [bacterium]|nr:superoxide reductase [bacterium]
MTQIAELFKTADWKAEKHVPVIEIAGAAKKGQPVAVTVSVGKEIPHPNTTAHFIAWIDVYFMPAEGKFPCQIGRAEFAAHGASTEGPDTSTVYTAPSATFVFKTDRPGTILAMSYCNIHGLWQNSAALALQ